MLLIQGTIRENSLASKVFDYVKSICGSKIKASLTLEKFNTIPTTYLSGTDELYLFGHKAVILILSSYYVMPPALFLNWLNQLNQKQLIDIFADKTVFIISTQGEGNLNEVPVNIIRTLLIKMFDFNDIEAKICIKHAMVNKDNLNDGRIDRLIEKYIC
ncbi:MAG: hypothetical protein IT245_04530 [Bacteroidia bacterium]|nr:hypothetical protein [Bacteroidia bacterium]